VAVHFLPDITIHSWHFVRLISLLVVLLPVTFLGYTVDLPVAFPFCRLVFYLQLLCSFGVLWAPIVSIYYYLLMLQVTRCLFRLVSEPFPVGIQAFFYDYPYAV